MPRPSKPLRLLLIDDSVGQRDLYEAALAAEFAILTATRGETGAALAESEQPDAIVLDVMMPGIDGWETCARIKRNPATADLPVILLTGTSEPDLTERAEAVGAAAILMKPCPAGTLRDTVLSAINTPAAAAPRRPAATKAPAAGPGTLWEAAVDRTTWTATLRDDDPPGCWKVQILRAGELTANRRFESREHAVAWAEARRVDLGGAALTRKH